MKVGVCKSLKAYFLAIFIPLTVDSLTSLAKPNCNDGKILATG